MIEVTASGDSGCVEREVGLRAAMVLLMFKTSVKGTTESRKYAFPVYQADTADR